MIQKLATLVIVFILGIVATLSYQNLNSQTEFQIPENNAEGGFEYEDQSTIEKMLIGLTNSPNEQNSPKDRISEDQILVNRERIQINLQDATWATFTDTNSMDPVIDAGANAIEVTPRNEKDLQVGDIVAYESEYADGTIIHRIAHIGIDDEGTYFIMKGDNNPTSDPGKVRFSQIKKVVVAIIY